MLFRIWIARRLEKLIAIVLQKEAMVCTRERVDGVDGDAVTFRFLTPVPVVDDVEVKESR